jgi:hypothetical protein
LEIQHILANRPYEIFQLESYRYTSTKFVYRKWRARRIEVENTFGILKKKIQFFCNLNMDLEYAPIVITACSMLHNFLIKERDIGENK